MSRKKLVLFTNSFPFGEGEQFIETEIEFLAREFDKVYIFPFSISGQQRQVPSNVEIVEPKLFQPYNTKALFFKNVFLLLHVLTITILKSKHRSIYIKQIRKLSFSLLHRINDANWLEERLKPIMDSNTVVYSYWFNTWCRLLSLIRKRGRLKFDFITRIHGGDFDEAQNKEGFFAYREFELTQVERIYAVSNYGINYMKQAYKNNRFSIILSRLGVNNYGDNLYSTDKGYLQIVSCSFIYGLKRVNLIVDILSNIKDAKVKWTHFGNGELANDVLNDARQKLGGNIEVDFRGLVPNKEIVEYYKTNPVDLFLNTSELEGIPVSMMEAISFGIPVIGCDICGVPEIVTEQTGLLIPKQFDPGTVAAQILNFLAVSASEMEEKRKKVKEFWYQHFNAESNYLHFLKLINPALYNRN